MLNYDEIKKYWNERAAADPSAQSTTQDFYLREIEHAALSERIAKFSPSVVTDVGCGDGRTTSRLAAKFEAASFTGFDYSSSMVDNARKNAEAEGLTNIKFGQLDISDGLIGVFDLVYTTRCLINLPSWELQKNAIHNIHSALTHNGVYLMVENFVDGQENFNKARKDFGLSEISIRDHNLFFDRDKLLEFVSDRFDVIEEVNISSSYYLVSRIVYSKICAETGKQPDYFDDHHRLAAGLPFCGEYGPVRLIYLKKK